MLITSLLIGGGFTLGVLFIAAIFVDKKKRNGCVSMDIAMSCASFGIMTLGIIKM